MADNDIILLNNILEQKKKQVANSLADDDFFEIFTFEQILKNYELSYEEFMSGKIGGGDDGGIDGFFAFINDELLDEDTDLSIFKKNPTIVLFLIQAKRSPSFSEIAVERTITTVEEIFDLTKDMSVLRSIYNANLIDKAEMFRKAYLELAANHPRLQVNYHFASKGDTNNIHPKVCHKAETLNDIISKKFAGASAKNVFIGARELLERSRQEKSYTLQLHFLENYISRGADNYVILSTLKDYYDFVIDEDDKLRRYIFESNVRDYQGAVEVNRDIQLTLESNDKLDFWWLNNGITILASKASIVGKTITLDDVQIVNGLQTTTTIYNHLKRKNTKEENRSILIRIIVTSDTETRDRIIKATNFQTAIPPASLRATDRIHRDIEDYFLSHNWFYERRKNYYKNLGKQVDKIISIPYLAQAVMAVVLCEPHNARSKPSSLIKRDVDYKRVFDNSFKLGMYLFCAKIIKTIDMFIRSYANDYSVHIKSNLKYHLAMLLMFKILKKTKYVSKEIESLESFELDATSDMLNQALSELVQIAQKYSVSQGNQPINTIAKSKAFVTFLIKEYDSVLNQVGLNNILTEGK